MQCTSLFMTSDVNLLENVINYSQNDFGNKV